MGIAMFVVAALALAAWVGAISFPNAFPITVGLKSHENARSDQPKDPDSSVGSEGIASTEAVSEKSNLGKARLDDPADEQAIDNASQEISDGTINVLVLGVDKRPNNPVEGYGSRTDTMMLVQIEPDTGKIELLSIPRDMYVETSPGEKDKINAAYNYGGIEQARAVVENFTGIHVDNYAIVDFQGFSEVIDAMGGVTLKITTEFPPNWKMEEGKVQTLDGRHALLYARYRGTPRADLERIERQQELVAALRSQALSWQSITKLPQYIKVINENVETDMDLDMAVALARLLIQHGRNAQMTSTQLQGAPTTLDNGSQVLIPEDDVNETILKNFRN